jgi:anti-sigma regulatory factor (Ser/Thr protein kinase)
MSELAGSFDLPAGAEAPGAARHAVASMLYGWGFRDPGWVQQTELIVSELVTNAVVHAGGWLLLELRAADDLVTVAAADGSTVAPRPRSGDDNGGHGLRIIEALSAAWGVDGYPSGKRVWVQLEPHPGTVERPPRQQRPSVVRG